MDKRVYILVGVPGSGKSTFRTLLKRVHGHRNWHIVSTDDYIENAAKRANKTYRDMFEDTIKDAEKYCDTHLNIALQRHANIIVDRTNLTAKAREKYLKLIPDGYRKIGVVMREVPDEELKERLNRPGKEIPDEVLEGMKKRFEYPKMTEGFDDIYEWPQEIDLDRETSKI